MNQRPDCPGPKQRDSHSRAEQLIARERIEGLSPAERTWLAGHLGECPHCTELAGQTDSALRRFRSAPIPVPPGLASRTQFRVRLRARELSFGPPRRRFLWLACGISWVFGISSAPFVWRLFGWFGQRTGLPRLVWELGFGLWWTIPAVFVAVVLLTESARQESGQAWKRPDRSRF